MGKIKGINVFGSFDGISCGQVALERAGIKVNNYYASEVDKYAIQVTQKNYPNTIQLGDITKINTKKLPKIDLLIGGSPCQGFSMAGKRKGAVTKENIAVTSLEFYLELKKGGFEFEGQSYLFWEFIILYKALKKKNPKLQFLLENTRMEKRWKNLITKQLGIAPVEINSSLVSAQERKRLYWTNITGTAKTLFEDITIISQPKDREILLKDILIDGSNQIGALRGRYSVKGKKKITQRLELRKDSKSIALTTVQKDNLVIIEDKYYFSKKRVNYFLNRPKNYSVKINPDKTNTLRTNYGNSSSNETYIKDAKGYRKLVPIECERLQTLMDDYTAGISDSQRYKCLGNCWTVDVVVHILKGFKN